MLRGGGAGQGSSSHLSRADDAPAPGPRLGALAHVGIPRQELAPGAGPAGPRGSRDRGGARPWGGSRKGATLTGPESGKDPSRSGPALGHPPTRRVSRGRHCRRASPNKPEAGKTARRTPRVAKPGGHTGLPLAHARTPYTAGSREDEEPGVTRSPGPARPRDRHDSLLGGRKHPATKARRRPTTFGPNPGGGPDGQYRPVGGSLKAPPGKRP